MTFIYADEKIMMVARQEIQHRADSSFLWSCYWRFRAMFPPERNDNLILVWESDYKRLWEKANGQRSASK